MEKEKKSERERRKFTCKNQKFDKINKSKNVYEQGLVGWATVLNEGANVVY